MKRTLVDVVYTKSQQRRLRKVWVGRAVMFVIRWIGSYVYVDIMLEARELRGAVQIAGIIR